MATANSQGNGGLRVPWQDIDTVFLDMDGTLLDLRFDNEFWREHIPRCYARKHGLDIQMAKADLFPRYQRVEGTIQWYCIDYWSRELALDIAALKGELEELIALHPYVLDFLDALRNVRKRVVLVTNAHSKSLALKLSRTGLGACVDRVVCAHDLGIPKENLDFWPCLQEREVFRPQRTLLIDDSLPVLRAARAYGIGYLLSVCQPDSQGPPRAADEFPMVRSFAELLAAPMVGAEKLDAIPDG
ncbi:MAG: GMP/IMP nucleotidase [Gammaproteobacteria bacterium]